MDSKLHKTKIEILSRLIKESSLTLEEALLLLQEEKQVVDNQHSVTHIISNDSIIGTILPKGSTWNSSCSYVKYDETPTL